MNENLVFGLFMIGIVLVIFVPIYVITTPATPKNKKMTTVKLSDVLAMVESIAVANDIKTFHVSAHMSAGYNTIFKAFVFGIGDVQGISVEELKEKLLAIKKRTSWTEGAATVISVAAPKPPVTTFVPTKPQVFVEVLADTYK